MVNICIIHYNTPFLTECLIKSINKYTPDCKIYIFDNSDTKPFTYKQDNIIYFDNTKGQIINFEEWLKKFKNKLTSGSPATNKYASAKHTITIEKCIELIDENFILLDSDILLKRDISELFDSNYLWVGSIENNLRNIERVVPYILFINVSMYKSKNYRVFNENYMHGLSLAGNSYDTCAYFYNITKADKVKVIDYHNYIVHYKAGSWEQVAKKFNNYKQIPQDMWLNNNRKYWKELNSNNKVVIYTAITGNYDDLMIQPYVRDDFDYVCFTDNPALESGLYDIRPIPEELNSLSTVKKQRCIKINPHLYLPEYDISVWLDGNTELRSNPLDFVDDNVIYIPEHPQRDCIYDEAKECIRQKKDIIEHINPQLNEYKKEGFPEHYGLVQSNIIIRKHNDKTCIKLMEDWWKEVKEKSHRDQLSFNYALWKNRDIKIKLLDKKIYDSPYFKWNSGHKKKLTIVRKIDTRSSVDSKLITTNFGGSHDIIRCRPINSEQPKKQTILFPQSIKRIFY